MIKTINLQKIFKTEEVETWALNNVSIEVEARRVRCHYGTFRLWKVNIAQYSWVIGQSDRRGILPQWNRSFQITQSHSVPAFVKE